MNSTIEMINKFFRRLVKGLILLSWISLFFYLGVSIQSGSENLIKGVSQIFGVYILDFDYSPNCKPRHSYSYSIMEPYEYLDEYISQEYGYYSEFPPLESILNTIVENKSYRGLTNDHLRRDSLDAYSAKIQYFGFFCELDRQIRDLVKSEDSPDNEQILVDPSFAELHGLAIDAFNVSVPLTVSMINYINDNRQEIARKKESMELYGDFVFLLILGGFGSLIFLTRDYLQKEKYTSIETYIFRPFLGMFLAMSMYILDLAAHSLISTTGVTEMRIEPLYLIAFAAGLLSEQVYQAVQIRAEGAIEKYKKQLKSTTK